MKDAVPISSFIGFAATTLWFIMLFKDKHPKNVERNCINYELVVLVIPSIFFGSFIGVLIKDLINETTQQILFCIVILWSIYTSG